MSYNFKDAQLTYFNQDLNLTSKLKGVFQTTVGGAAFGTVGAASSASQTFSLKGLLVASGAGTPPNIAPGDTVIVSPTAALTSGLAVYAFVSAANTLTVTLVNGSAGGIAGGSPNFVVTILKFGQVDGLSS